jgi:Replication-relaxation
MTTNSLTTNRALKIASRLPTIQRSAEKTLPGFRLTARDQEIIQAVWEYRALTTVQIERLFFSGAHRAADASAGSGKINPRCQLRLKYLYHYGYLHRDEQPRKRTEPSKPLVYFLDVMGAELLSQQQDEQIDWDPADNDVTDLFLQHLLLENDFRIAITLAAEAASEVSLTKWIDDKALKSPHMKDYVTLQGAHGGTKRMAVVPDGYFVLETDDKIYHHFLEIDRAMVPVAYTREGKRDWAHRIRAYLEYLRSGKYEARYHAKGLRILTVTTGEKRLEHLRAATAEVGGGSRFYFTTFAQATPEAILAKPIWRVVGSEEPRSLFG